MIVDDEPKNLTVLEAILDDPGYRLVRAESAEHALLAVLVDEIALLILDIRMPEVTGIVLARMVKARQKTVLFRSIDTTLARIMHHAALFCTSGRRTRAVVRSCWTGVRPLAVQRVWD